MPEPGEDAGDAVVAHVDAATGARDPAHAVDGALPVAPVLEHDGELLRSPSPSLGRTSAMKPSDLRMWATRLLEAAGGNLGTVVPRQTRVADPGQHVGDRIGHHGVTSWP